MNVNSEIFMEPLTFLRVMDSFENLIKFSKKEKHTEFCCHIQERMYLCHEENKRDKHVLISFMYN